MLNWVDVLKPPHPKQAEGRQPHALMRVNANAVRPCCCISTITDPHRTTSDANNNIFISSCCWRSAIPAVHGTGLMSLSFTIAEMIAGAITYLCMTEL